MEEVISVKERALKESIDNYNIRLNEHIPLWLQAFDQLPLGDYKLDIYGGVKYLLLDEQYYLESDKSVRFKRSIKQVVNMQGVEECSNILLEFNPRYDIVCIHEIVVFRNNTVIKKIESADMQVFRNEYRIGMKILSGDATLSIILDDIRVDDIIEYSCSITNTNQFNIDFFSRLIPLEYGVPVYQFHFALICNKSVDIEYKFLDSVKEITKLELLDKIIYSLDMLNIQGKKIEKYLPYWYRLVSCLQIRIQKSWNEIAISQERFYKELDIVSPMLVELINNIKNEQISKEAIVLRGLKFVHDNIRYLANHKATDYIVPSDPNVVVQRLYGDCKDFVYLVLSILRKFNIPAHPVLVNTSIGRNLIDYLPASNLFDHIIILVEIDNVQYFIDPTLQQNVESLKYLYLSDYGYGLVCSNYSKDLLYVKNISSCNNHISVVDEYRFISWEDNQMTFHTNMILEGWPALKLLRAKESQPEKELWESLSRFYDKFFNIDEILLNEFNVDQLGKNKISISLKYKGSIRAFIKHKKEHGYEIVATDIVEHNNCELPNDVSCDFYYGSRLSIDYKIIVLSPKNNFNFSKSDVIQDNAFMLSKQEEGTNGSLTIKYNFQKYSDVVLRDNYKTFFENQIKARSLLYTYISKKTKSFLNRTFSVITCVLCFYLYLFFVANNNIFHNRSDNNYIEKDKLTNKEMLNQSTQSE